jgi:membrane protease YdiL (CAAX protease family)
LPTVAPCTSNQTAHVISPDLQRSLTVALLPGIAIAYVVYRGRKRRGGSLAWLGVLPSPAVPTALWVIGYAGWMLASNAVLHWRGPWDFTHWQQMALVSVLLRVVGIGVLGPVAEELIFRGFLYQLVLPRLGVAAAIAVTAVVWAVLHVQYHFWIIVLILIDGLLLGAARHQTRSILAPTLMHIVWNLYAVW